MKTLFMWLAPKQDSKPLTEVTVYLDVGESVEGWTISWPNRTYTPPPNISVACAYDGVECGYLDVDPADYAVVVDCLVRPKLLEDLTDASPRIFRGITFHRHRVGTESVFLPEGLTLERALTVVETASSDFRTALARAFSG